MAPRGRLPLALQLASLLAVLQGARAQVWLNYNLTFAERAAALVAAMTPAEKLVQLNSNTTAIPRLGIPAFDYWTGCAHGASMWGLPGWDDPQGATQFPMGLGLAATFDTKLMQQARHCAGAGGCVRGSFSRPDSGGCRPPTERSCPASVAAPAPLHPTSPLGSHRHW